MTDGGLATVGSETIYSLSRYDWIRLVGALYYGGQGYRPFASDEELDQLVVDQERAREEPEAEWLSHLADDLAGTE